MLAVQLRPQDAPLPAVVAPPNAAADRLAQWRAAFPAVDALICAGVSPSAALRRLGLTFWSAGEAQAAAEALTESVALEPGDAAAWLDLGFARRAAAQTPAALAAFERAADLAPDMARIWLAVGLTAKDLGEIRRAEAALEKALSLDPALDDATYVLGLLCFEARRYAEAARQWRALVERGYTAPGLWLGLGQCQFFLGEFAAAAHSLAEYLKTAPGDAAITRRLTLVRFLEGAIHGGPEGALAAYQLASGDPAASITLIARNAVPLLAGYGYVATALSVARAFLASDADDPVHRHQIAALTAEPVSRAPAEYVAAYFDRFAESFDTQMFEVLQYCGPRKLSRLVAATGSPSARTLDLGCGTGAAGALLRPGASRLVGVDLSANMLDKARAKGVYDDLDQADMIEYLAARRGAFDLIFAADSLIYLGDLSALLEAAAGALAPGGSLALTLEATTRSAYELTTSGRFAHSPRATIAAAAPWFSLRASKRAFLRLEAHRRIHGALIVLERRG